MHFYTFSTLVLLLAAAIPPRTAAQADQQDPRTSSGLGSAAYGFGNGANLPVYSGVGGYRNYYGEGAGNFYTDPYSSYGNFYPHSGYYARQSSDPSHANCDMSSSAAKAQQDASAKAAYQQQFAQQQQQLRASQHPLPILPDLDEVRGGRQLFQQPLPLTELTYSRKDMERVYGANFQPPIFTVAKRQPHAIQGFDTRYLAPQQQFQQQFQHPLPVLRSADLASMRAGAKYEPTTNLYIERPLGEYEAVSGFRSSEPICREKRQVDYQYGYPAENSYYDQMKYGEEARSALPSPLFRRPSPWGISPAYSGRHQYSSPYGPHSRGAVEGIQQVIGGFTQFLPMLAGNAR